MGRRGEGARRTRPGSPWRSPWAPAGLPASATLAWIVGRDERLVSHHARALKAAGLARSEREGKMVMYELTDRGRALLDAVVAEEVPAP